jgi:hypothetical protein
MKMLRAVVCAGIFLACGITILATQAAGDDQTKPGKGNAAAIAVAKKSPILQSAFQFLLSQAARIQDATLRKQTLDGLGDPAFANART